VNSEQLTVNSEQLSLCAAKLDNVLAKRVLRTRVLVANTTQIRWVKVHNSIKCHSTL